MLRFAYPRLTNPHSNKAYYPRTAESSEYIQPDISYLRASAAEYLDSLIDECSEKSIRHCRNENHLFVKECSFAIPAIHANKGSELHPKHCILGEVCHLPYQVIRDILWIKKKRQQWVQQFQSSPAFIR